jgi:hypothetical protein
MTAFQGVYRWVSSGEVSERSGIGEEETMEHPWEQQLPADDEFGRPDVRQLEMAREMWRHRVMAICKAALKPRIPMAGWGR